MKKLLVTSLLLASICLASCDENECLPKASYNNPACIVSDDEGIFYYVSNRGNGTILKIDESESEISSFSHLSQPKGLTILNSILYVALNTSIKGFDITTEEEVFSVSISGSKYLNGITSDNDQFLYITDTHKHLVFKLNVESKEYEIISNSDVTNPIGITYNETDNSLIIASGSANSSIFSLNFNNNEVSEIISSDFDYFDFIVEDGYGNYFVSCWGTHSVYLFKPGIEPEFQLFSEGHKGPSGLFYNKKNKILIVPNFEGNNLDFLEYKYFENGLQLIDFDGNIYNTLKIGDKYWMTENFQCTHDADGKEITEMYIYDNNENNLDKYGRLYSYESALNSAPAGWHLPTDDEWKMLEMEIGMSESEANNSGWRGTNEATMLLKGRYIGFNSEMSGYYRYSEKTFKGLGEHASFWTATQDNSNQIWGREVFKNNSQISRCLHPKNFGFSVRYVKD